MKNLFQRYQKNYLLFQNYLKFKKKTLINILNSFETKKKYLKLKKNLQLMQEIRKLNYKFRKKFEKYLHIEQKCVQEIIFKLPKKLLL